MRIYNAKPNIDLFDVIRFEKEFGFTYPASYKQFLLENNGGYPSEKFLFVDRTKYIVYYFLPIKHSNYNQEIIINKLTKSLKSKDLFPFAIDNFGNYYSFNLKKEIVYWKILSETQTVIASSFECFLGLLLNKYNIKDTKDKIPYKTYQGKDYTKEEWEKLEEEEYKKYVKKRNNKKSSFLADEEIDNQNFSAESGTLKEVQYFVMNFKQDKVPVYEFPSAMVAPISFLANGIAIDVLKYEEDGWCEILSKDGKTAFIQSNFVKKND